MGHFVSSQTSPLTRQRDPPLKGRIPPARLALADHRLLTSEVLIGHTGAMVKSSAIVRRRTSRSARMR
jgi:hypothetical protein